jgi:glycosyltransferase involved in cell wall biosynthesis
MNRLAGLRCALNVFGGFRPGSDPFHARVGALARAGNVRFRGPFDNERIAEVYREIDVLVVPSLWFENSPLTIHEAFLFKTPVVTSGIGGMAELVRDGVDGLHTRPGDPAHLASALKRFVDEPDLAIRLSRGVPRVKSIAEDAQEHEARYRNLARR